MRAARERGNEPPGRFADDQPPFVADDPFLEAGFEATGEEDVDAVALWELGLGRPRVLSAEGREAAAQRWYDSEHGPDTPLAQAAPAPCASCGFLVRLAGPLSQAFGVCANAYANDDGKVVSLDHGCGAHSDAQLSKKQLPRPLPEPALDTLRLDDLETF